MMLRKIKILSVVLVLMSAGISLAKAQGGSQCGEDVAATDIGCQMESYRRAALPCQSEVSECALQIQQSFKFLEASFNRCLPQSADGAGFEGSVATREECSVLEKFVIEQVISNNPSFGQVARALKFINQRAQAKSIGRKQAGL